MHLEESEDIRRHKHRTLPRKVNRDEHDGRRIAHLQVRSRGGKAVDHAHRWEGTISSWQEQQFHIM